MRRLKAAELASIMPKANGERWVAPLNIYSCLHVLYLVKHLAEDQ
jgi:hypothetical protein